ncbi:MAG: ATPase [Bacteroidetes bacterium]|nr:ATPase [Bacteroidota bacterium]
MATNHSRLMLNAPKEKVWEALTNPEKVKAWQYGSILITDWKPGNEIRFKTEWEGHLFEQWGTVLEFKPYESLKYRLFAPSPDLEDKPENYFVMEYKLVEKDNGTELLIIQEDNRPGAKQEEEQGIENPVLSMLRDLIEQKHSAA